MKRDVTLTEFTREIVDALEAAGVDYMLGGGIATWVWGDFRTTNDLDVVVRLDDEKIEALCEELVKRDMHVPPDIVRDLIAETRIDIPINAIHGFSGLKAELFPLRDHDRLRASALDRRRRVEYPPPIGTVYVHAPEDLILYKLQYYAISRQTKHNRDIAAILASGHELDRGYIERWAEELGVLEIWHEFTGG